MLFGRTGRDRFREPNLDGSFKRITMFLGAGVEKESSPESKSTLSNVKSNPPRARLVNQKSSSQKLKLQFQAQEAEADLDAFHQQKAKQKEETIQEKKKDLEDLKAYKPWGKPAGGAPQVTPSGKVKAPGSQRYDPNEGKSISLQNQPRRWEVTSNFNSQILTTDSDKARLERERIKKQHYAQALEKQRQEKQEMKKSTQGDTNSTFIWGKNIDANRDKNGRLLPRRRAIGGPGPDDESLPPKSIVGEDKYVSIVEKMSQTEPRGKNRQEKSLLPWEQGNPQSYVKINHLTDRKQSDHIQLDVDKVKESRGEGIEAATWMRTGAVGMPKKEVYPATGHVIGGKRCTTDLTFQASRKRSGHHQIQVDKSQASKGDGLDMATLMRAGTVGMPKKAIDPATGHVMSVSRQAADLTVLVNRKKPTPSCLRQNNPDGQQYSLDLQKQSELRQKEREAERKRRIEQEMTHTQNASDMWDMNKEMTEHRRGFRGMDWSGRREDKEAEKAKKTEYRKQLEQITAEKKTEQEVEKGRTRDDEKKHLERQAKDWGRPGGGAPRLGTDGKIEAARLRKDSLEHLATIHSGWGFRRTNWL